VSTSRFFGIIFFSISLHAQILSAPSRTAPPAPFAGPLLSASGDGPIGAEFPMFPPAPSPITGVVSLRELEHPISKKALRAAYQAQEFVCANKIPEAIAKLEKAIRIDPQYRDAHVNLGVQYARQGRPADARAQFQKALDIGPPIASIYANLAFASLTLRQFEDAAGFARKALEMDPACSRAQRALEYALIH
jgi:tetratricopeptide (TPR) repeat protein